MNKFKVFLAVSFIVMILTPLALGAVQGSTCDYNDGGEMIYMGMTSWEIVLSYYDSIMMYGSSDVTGSICAMSTVHMWSEVLN